MKPTPKQIEREAKRLLHIYANRDMEAVARHVLRRIAAAERRGFNLGKDATEAKYDDSETRQAIDSARGKEKA